MRRLAATLLLAFAALVAACGGRGRDLVVGAVYPTAGGQGPGGIEEERGVLLAAELANAAGGVAGRRIRVVAEPADAAEGAPEAVRRLVHARATVVLGSYGSTISRAAAAEAARRGVVFWETGAVGMLDVGDAAGRLVFRFPPTGSSLGRNAVVFVRDRLLPALGEHGRLRFAVAYVDDVYGRAVGSGALEEIRSSGLSLAGVFPYGIAGFDADGLAARIGAARPDVLVVAAYLEDAVAMRRALVARRVRLVAGIGTSSSYCMLEFGQALGPDAVGLFASDKPSGDVIDPARLSPEAARTLERARDAYRRRYGEPMSAAALSGFAAAWALFHHVLPRASSLRPEAVAAAARAVRLPEGSLPNGSGLAFAPPGSPDAGANLAATSVIWEWVAPGVRAVVWPPAFATHPLVPLRPR
jgi:branched-chain amino acid transport system substrate-binding protein